MTNYRLVLDESLVRSNAFQHKIILSRQKYQLLWKWFSVPWMQSSFWLEGMLVDTQQLQVTWWLRIRNSPYIKDDAVRYHNNHNYASQHFNDESILREYTKIVVKVLTSTVDIYSIPFNSWIAVVWSACSSLDGWGTITDGWRDWWMNHELSADQLLGYDRCIIPDMVYIWM